MGSMAVMAVSALVGTALSMALTPSQSNYQAPVYDYSALRELEAEKSVDAEEQRAAQEEAKRREELRVQSMYGQDIMTSDHGDDDDLKVKETVLGDKDDDREGTSSTGKV